MTDALFLFDPTCDNTPINSDELHTGWKLILPAHVRKHAIQVMRLGEGDSIQLSDGQGLRIQASIQDPKTGMVEVTAVGKEPSKTISLILVQALAKGGHDEQAINVSTQIGVDAVIPWQADRSIAKWKKGKTDNKWSNVLASATEQSRRSWKPILHECMSSRQLTQYCENESSQGNMVILLHQDASHSWMQIKQQLRNMSDSQRQSKISIIVGPEGGVSDTEVESFVKAGAQATLLGENIMRASAAGPTALAVISDIVGRYDI